MTAIKHFYPLLAILLAAAMPWRCFGANPDAPLSENIVAPTESTPQPNFRSVGPAISGSVDYDKLPSKARKFLERYCDGHAIVKCDKTYESGEYNIELSDGIDMSFNSKGELTDITAPDQYSLSPYLLKAVVPGKLYNLLEHNGFRESVEAVHESNKKFYRLEISDPVFTEICFDKSGVLTLIADR